MIMILMIFGSDYLKFGDDFLQLIQIMTADFIQEYGVIFIFIQTIMIIIGD